MRVFVAIVPPAKIRTSIATQIERARPELPPAKWISADNLHLTLLFLGEIEPRQAEALSVKLRPVFSARPPLVLTLGEPGCFPPRGAARVVWIGLAPSASLATLQREVEETWRSLGGGGSTRREWSAHLTVARCRRPWPRRAARRWRRAIQSARESFTVEEGRVIESRLEPNGARYRTLASLPLQGLG